MWLIQQLRVSMALQSTKTYACSPKASSWCLLFFLYMFLPQNHSKEEWQGGEREIKAMRHLNCVLLLQKKNKRCFYWCSSTTFCWNWWAALHRFWVRLVSSGNATTMLLPTAYFQSRSCPCCCCWLKLRPTLWYFQSSFFFFSFSFFFLPPPQVFSLEMSAWDSSINIHSTLAH